MHSAGIDVKLIARTPEIISIPSNKVKPVKSPVGTKGQHMGKPGGLGNVADGVNHV